MHGLLRTAAIALVSLALPMAGYARGSITGQVKDASGKAVPGVRVEASTDNHSSDAHAMHLMQMALHGLHADHAEQVQTRHSAITNAQGKYKITDLGPGKFNVQYTAPRLRTLRREGVAVSNSKSVPLNVVMDATTAAQTKAQASVQAAVLATVQDQYSPIVEWHQSSGDATKPIHVSLLPGGALFFMEPFFGMVPGPHNVPPPATFEVSPIRSPIPGLTYDPETGVQTGKMLTCAGHALMADGNLLFSGGTYVSWNVKNAGTPPAGAVVRGLAESPIFNTSSGTWISNADSVGVGSASGDPLRWYPTVTRLADSAMMLTGGYEGVFPSFEHNRSVDVLNSVTKRWSTISDFTKTPEGIANPDYTHVYQFPNDHFDVQTAVNYDVVMMLGGSAEPMLLFMNGQKNHWQRSGKFRPGAKQYIDASAPKLVHPNYGSSSAMLPLRLPEGSWGYSNGSVINVGGDTGTVMEGNIDVYDPGLNEWKPSIPMSGRRHYPTATILPDGRILIIAGYAPAGEVDQTGYAEYIDPKNNFAHSIGVAHMPEVRGYHSMVILLPDGRVMVGGGNDDGGIGTEKSNFRYYYPDYMFKQRPEIVWVESTIKIANYFPLVVPYLTKVDEISLLALGSMTHSFDMGQRSVQLRLHSAHFIVKKDAKDQLVPAVPSECVSGTITCFDKYLVQSPIARELAPPGHYMLFVLDENRIPSLGKIVKLEP